MTNQMIKIHNVETGEIVEREMTEEELENLQVIQTGAAEEKQAAETAAIAKAALLTRLGITADEAKLLLN